MLIRIALAALLCAAPLTAQNCTITNVGPGCGPTLTATFRPIGGNNHKLDLLVTGAYAREPALMIWGVDPISIKLPGSMCTFYTLWVWGSKFQANANGEVSWSRAWPGVHHLAFYIQFGTYRFDNSGNFEFKLTNGVLAQCQ